MGTTEREIACLLSGGLDSSLISALVNKYYQKLTGNSVHTWSIGFKGSEDLKFAEQVANHIGSNHHSISTAVAQNGESASDSVAHSYLDSPNTTSATTYAVYMRSGTGGGNIGIGNYAIGGDGSTRSTMILTEISA